MLRKLNDSLQNDNNLELIHAINDKIQFVSDIGELYKISFKKFVQELSEVTLFYYYTNISSLIKTYIPRLIIKVASKCIKHWKKLS